MRNNPKYKSSTFDYVLDNIANDQITDFYHKRFSGNAYNEKEPSLELALNGLRRIDFIGFFYELDAFSKRVAKDVFNIELNIKRIHVAPEKPLVSQQSKMKN